MPRLQNRLTDRALRHLNPDPLKAYDLADGGDLYVRVETSGTRVFWLRYQLNGKRRRLVLGHYGGEAGMSLAEARSARERARNLLRDKVDPAAKKRADQDTRRREQLAAEQRAREAERREEQTVAWLVEEFARLELPVAHSDPSWGTALLRKHVGQRLGALPLAELTTLKLWECLDPLRGAQPATARHVYGLMRKLSAFGVRRGYLGADPAATIERKTVARKPPARQRVLNDQEIRHLWFDFGDGRVSRQAWLALRFLLAVGQRRGEVMGAQWSEFDLRAKRWLIPVQRLGKKKNVAAATPHLVPLSALGLSVLKDLKALASDSPWLLPSTQDKSRPMDARALNRAITRKDLGWSPHDVRRTVRTRLSALEIPAIVAERVIGHELPELIAVYDVHAYEAEKRAALDKWAGELRRILKI
jgi:integrase